MKNSLIEWTDHTFNPWQGCYKVSPACYNCYACTQSKRYGKEIWVKGGSRILASGDYWAEPFKWDREAQRSGVRRRVFSGSMCDVFEKRPDLDPLRERLWKTIKHTPNLDWLLLTKRPGNIVKMMPDEGFPPNVWLGATVESQEYVGRIKQLLRAPASIHFISAEPLLSSLDLSEWMPELDWVIAGGESGGHSRPTNPDWFRSLRDQCIESGVAFHFKQHGCWTPEKPEAKFTEHYIEDFGITMFRTTKKAAGRMLDGRTWDGLPEVHY